MYSVPAFEQSILIRPDVHRLINNQAIRDLPPFTPHHSRPWTTKDLKPTKSQSSTTGTNKPITTPLPSLSPSHLQHTNILPQHHIHGNPPLIRPPSSPPPTFSRPSTLPPNANLHPSEQNRTQDKEGKPKRVSHQESDSRCSG